MVDAERMLLIPWLLLALHLESQREKQSPHNEAGDMQSPRIPQKNKILALAYSKSDRETTQLKVIFEAREQCKEY